jgi:MFS superfamily sulfate permease-like transporter
LGDKFDLDQLKQLPGFDKFMESFTSGASKKSQPGANQTDSFKEQTGARPDKGRNVSVLDGKVFFAKASKIRGRVRSDIVEERDKMRRRQFEEEHGTSWRDKLK